MADRLSGSGQAALAIWDWRKVGGAAVANASHLRRSGVLRAAIGATVGGLFFWYGALWMAGIAWGIAAVLGLLAIASPARGYAAVDRSLARLAQVVGQLVGWGALVPVFYLVFVPFGLLARRGDADTMKRRYDPGARTYWRDRPADEPTLDRQF